MRAAKPLVVSFAVLAMSTAVAAAQEFKTYVSNKPFDDVRFELGNAVVARGFAIQSEGNIAKMLDRTAADVGASKSVYKNGEFVAFCSAKYTRMMVEADPANFGNCPFLVFAYETKDKPGEVVVGFRGLGTAKTEATKKVFAEIETMLDGLIKETVK